MCKHEKTGVTVGSGDGLIGSCEIDLKQLLFSSESGVHDGMKYCYIEYSCIVHDAAVGMIAWNTMMTSRRLTKNATALGCCG